MLGPANREEPLIELGVEALVDVLIKHRHIRIAVGALVLLFPGPATASPRRNPLGGGPTLRYGDSGPGVRAVQKRLRQLGFAPGPVDGFFGDELKPALWASERYAPAMPVRTPQIRTAR